ncbi:MAG: ISNCY family transposase [Rhabdochlamydiaceae bacterium]
MRQRFEQQLSLRTVAIQDVKFPLKSRDELPPVLKALQYIFITPELNKKVFALLEEKICKDKKKTGRKGMDLWHILVLAVVRHTLDTNWDRLHYLSNYDELLRSIMGVHATAFIEEQKPEFNYQTIIDNVSLIDEDLLQDLNQIVLEAGYVLIKKKEEALRLKTDSYVLETNIHFPTDLNLLWDSSRKCLDIIGQLNEGSTLTGWRKIKYIRKTIKSQFRKTSHQVFRGRNEQQKRKEVTEYLRQATELSQRGEGVIKHLALNILEPETVALLEELQKYGDFVKKFTDQIERRLLKGEVIPAEEKVYSVFEEHTEWITKGKLNKKVELGHLLLITADQYQFIVDYTVMEKQKDPSQVRGLQPRIKENLPGIQIYSHSFDKGFWSKSNLEVLQQSETKQIILPKRGKLTKSEKEREGTKEFKALRNAHSAIESDINMLEHHGLNRCMDKGMRGFKRNVGLSVLAYNLHRLGNVLIAKEKKEAERKERRKSALRKAA